jgi:hypothetical protein
MRRSKYIAVGVMFFAWHTTSAQELFVFTEPASNMATHSIGLRLNNSLMKERATGRINYHLIPEVMVGVSNKLMVHGETFFSNRNTGLDFEGGGVYAKYRFFSNDEVQRHFRMAVFGRLSANNSEIHQEEISLLGHNSGYEAGIIATQLLHKVAISSTVSYVKATDNGVNKFSYGLINSRAINYSLSVGKLVLPKEYTDYKQTNMNLMLEMLGQVNAGSGKYYFDLAPSVQFIFNSVSRVDIGYRKELAGSLLRTAPNGFYIRLEYNFFNAY